MNRKNILKVANAIESACRPDAKPEIGFNMGVWKASGRKDYTGHDCGTVACIAGWTEHLFPKTCPPISLGIDIHQFEALSMPPGWRTSRSYTPQHAVAVLRHLAETGRVDWSIAAPQTGDAS